MNIQVKGFLNQTKFKLAKYTVQSGEENTKVFKSIFTGTIAGVCSKSFAVAFHAWNPVWSRDRCWLQGDTRRTGNLGKLKCTYIKTKVYIQDPREFAV